MSVDANTPVPLTLPLGAVNVVLTALAKLPYEASAQIIESVRAQAQEAIDGANQPEPAGTTD